MLRNRPDVGVLFFRHQNIRWVRPEASHSRVAAVRVGEQAVHPAVDFCKRLQPQRDRDEESDAGIFLLVAKFVELKLDLLLLARKLQKCLKLDLD